MLHFALIKYNSYNSENVNRKYENRSDLIPKTGSRGGGGGGVGGQIRCIMEVAYFRPKRLFSRVG